MTPLQSCMGLQVSTPDFTSGFVCGREVYAQEADDGCLSTDTDLTEWVTAMFSRRARLRDLAFAQVVGDRPAPAAFQVGFLTGYLHDVLTAPRNQDIHISCPADQVEPLVAEFCQQFADNPRADVYDWGWSSKFQQGFIIVSFDGRTPADFLAQLDADPRLEGHSLSELPAEQPLSIAARKGA